MCGGTGLLVLHDAQISVRSIPACAGEPPSFGAAGLSRSTVYPRVCGGTVLLPVEPIPACAGEPETECPCLAGSIPGVRGNLVCLTRSIPACAGEPLAETLRGGTDNGSIPACAGEPFAYGARAASTAVYPRVCGGTKTSPSRLCLGLRQLSIPACAGEPSGTAAARQTEGSIPACAGEPTRRVRAQA